MTKKIDLSRQENHAAERPGDPPTETVPGNPLANPGGHPPEDPFIDRLAADLDAGRIDLEDVVASLVDQAVADAAGTRPTAQRVVIAETVAAIVAEDPYIASIKSRLIGRRSRSRSSGSAADPTIRRGNDA